LLNNAKVNKKYVDSVHEKNDGVGRESLLLITLWVEDLDNEMDSNVGNMTR